jgi:AcrR family transcriptional regulator
MAEEQVKDRRVEKTERLLRDALGSLIHEKSYDSIPVKEILQRANVGRSAFYAHFSDKDALLVAGIRQMLNELRSRSRSVHRFSDVMWFSHGLFEHIDGMRHTGTAMNTRKGRAVVHYHLRGVLLETVADALRQRAPQGVSRVPLEVLAEYIVGTFILVLHWWVDSRSTLSPREADAIFLSLVMPTLASTAESA